MFLFAWKKFNKQMRPLEFGINVWYDNCEDAPHNLASQVGWRLKWEDSETHWIDDIDELVGQDRRLLRYLEPFFRVLMEMRDDGDTQAHINATVSDGSAKNLQSESPSSPRSRLGFVPAFNLRLHRAVSFCRLTFDVEFVLPPEVKNFTPQFLFFYQKSKNQKSKMDLFRAKMTKSERRENSSGGGNSNSSGGSNSNSGNGGDGEDDVNEKNISKIYHVEFINQDFGDAMRQFIFLAKYFIRYHPVCEDNQICNSTAVDTIYS